MECGRGREAPYRGGPIADTQRSRKGRCAAMSASLAPAGPDSERYRAAHFQAGRYQAGPMYYSPTQIRAAEELIEAHGEAASKVALQYALDAYEQGRSGDGRAALELTQVVLTLLRS